MRRTICVVITLFSVLASTLAQRSASVEALLLEGLHAALRHEYASARLTFDAAARSAPDDPAGLVLLAGLLHQSAEDLSIPFDRHAFDSLLTQAEVRATSSVAANYPDRHMWRSTARGMLSVVGSQAGEWMAAIRDALASASEARTSLEEQADLADAGLPMGNYLYWRSRKTEAIQWLPFISDDRDEGIRLLEWCARDGRYHRWTAVSSLIWVLHDARRFGGAESWARAGLVAFPENRTYRAGLAMVLETRGAFREAADQWGAIAASLKRQPGAGRYAIFSAAVNQVRCVHAAGSTVEARRLMADLAPPSPSDVPEWLQARRLAKVREWEGLRTLLSHDEAPAASRESR